jgi:ectoine hydroxylase-related dioxygenase (phytanoyl-CoA dioxygenase family)
MTFNIDTFKENFFNNGYAIVENVLDKEFVEIAKAELVLAIANEVKYHGTENYSDYGMVLLCPLYNGAFVDIFNYPLLIKPMEALLGEGCIMYAYTSSSMPPYKTNYSNRIHVDSPRVISNYMTNLGVFIALSDITEENGAMHYLPASHNLVEQPSEIEFKEKSLRCTLKAGSAFFFNPRLWHAGGSNTTNNWRHALTMNVCRPFMKQRIDIPRALQHLDMTSWSDKAKQKLGFDAQVPASYEEYYVSPEKRKFKQPYE